VKIVAISGSLRTGSSNTSVLRALVALAPADIEVTFYEDLATLPPFNPDLDEEGMTAPFPVAAFRKQLREADAVLISTPEYAHGVPGVLKNALDWVVGSGELVEKPVAVINPSPRSTYAQASLLETLKVMNTNIIEQASVTLQGMGRNLEPSAVAANPELAASLRGSLQALREAASRQS
jgi:chromate reductase